MLLALKGGASPKLSELRLHDAIPFPDVKVLVDVLEARKTSGSCTRMTKLGGRWHENGEEADVLRIMRVCLPTLEKMAWSDCHTEAVAQCVEDIGALHLLSLDLGLNHQRRSCER